MAADTERDWARAHPQPRSQAEGERLTLWNYPVAGAALAPAHAQALDAFSAIELGLAPAACRTEFHVIGHASPSGAEAQNLALSQQRAEGVAAHLRRRGARQVTLTWMGAEAPLDTSGSGLAQARNRRVEVGKFDPAPPSKEVPLRAGPPRSDAVPGRPAQAADGGEGLTVKRPFETRRLRVRIRDLALDLRLIGEIELSAQTGEGARVLKGAVEGGKLAPEAEALITDGVCGIVGVQSGEGGQPATLKAGAQLERIAGKPEIGVQAGTQFAYVEFELSEVPLLAFELRGARITARFSGKLRLDIGPSEAAAARLAKWLAPAAPAAGAVAGAVAAAVVINGGTALLAQNARAEGLRLMEQLAERDGVATRVAHEVLGTDATPLAREQELQWCKLEGGTRAAFQAGVQQVEQLLRSLGPNGREARRKRWDAAYAAGLNAQDFPKVQRQVLDALGGSDPKAQGLPLEQL